MMKVNKMVRLLLVIVCSLAIITSNITAYGYYDIPPSKMSKQIEFDNIDFTHFYYNQLNDVEKEIYQNLVKSKQKFLNKEEIVFAIQPYNEGEQLDFKYYCNIVRRASKAYVYDNPESEIWFSIYDKHYLKKENYTYIKLTPKNVDKSNSDLSSNNIKNSITEFEKIATNFVSTLSGTEKQKLKQIHDWLIKRAIYDETLKKPNTNTAYGTIVDKTSVCSGFAYAFKYLSDLAGLKVIYVTGKIYKNTTNTYELHAWNIAFVDGKYVLIDVTLDNFSNHKPVSTFLFSPINDKMHYVDTYYFNYPF